MANNRYNFTSPGGAVVDELTQILAERDALRRQAMIDEITKRNVDSQIESRGRNDQLQQDQLAAVQKQQEYGQAKDIVAMAGGDERIAPDTKELLNRTGFGGRVEQRFAPGTPGIGVLAEDELPPDATVGEEVTTLKPGLAYEQARAAGEERRGIAGLQATERARLEAQRQQDRADAQEREHALRRDLQGNQIASAQSIAEAGRQNTAAIAAASREAAASNRAGIADVKAEAASKEQQARRASALGIADSMRDAIKDVADIDPLTGQASLKPGTAKMVGGSRWGLGLPAILGGSGVLPGAIAEKIPGSPAADARAAVKQIVGQRIVELMREMKSQSRTGATGFGALSEKELGLLQSASARLDTAQSDKAFTEALMDINRLVDKVYQENGAAPPAAMAPAVATPPMPTAKPTAADLINKYRKPR